MLHLLGIVLCALTAPLSTNDVGPDSWPQFRGPGGLCIADDTPIPTDFGPDKHVLWKAELPAGHSSPVIHANHIFLTGYEEGLNVVVAIDRSSGELLWKKTFKGEDIPEFYHVDAMPALPTGCTDGERLVVYFGGYGLIALDFEGEVIWERRMPHPDYGFGVGTSPILVEGLVILKRDGAAEAAVLAFDVSDGSEAWKIDRFEYGESHGTPFLWSNKDRDELILSGAGRLTAHDPGSGDLLWSVSGTTVFPCTTPTASQDMLYFAAWSTPNSTGRSFWEGGFGRSLELTEEELGDPALFFRRLDLDGDGHVTPAEVPECRAKDAFGFIDRNENGSWEEEELVGASTRPPTPGKNLMVAVSPGGSGDVSKSNVVWSHTRGLPYVASPLLYRDRIWLFKAGGVSSCLDAKTGELVFDRERLSDRSEYYLSPVGAAGHILLGTAEGTLYVLNAAADRLEVEHEVSFDEGLFATPAVLDGKVYLRTKHTLWAFGADD